MSDNLNKLMYQLSHLQVNSHTNYLMIGMVIFLICLAAILLYATYILDKESEVPWRTWAAIGMLIVLIFGFCTSTTIVNPFKYQTINQASITKLKQAKADVKTEYPYAITLDMYNDPNSNPEVYVLLFKNFNAAKSTSTYLNTAISSNDDGGTTTVFLHPDKNTIVLKCTTKQAGDTKVLRPIFTIKGYQKLTKTKTVDVAGASFKLTPTNKIAFTWTDDIF